MSERGHCILLAQYNAWMNTQLYAAAAKLPAGEFVAERGAFFGSLAGTLNHIVAGDTIWLRRFATHPARFPMLQALLEAPAPTGLTAMHSSDLAALTAHRQALDAIISAWAATLTDADLDHVLHYANTKGVVSNKRFGSLVLHFFNHQTHHRGQASTLLSQAGIDIGVTDLLMLVPNEA
ncbi:MAG: DinB family protein [Massilia sp.]